MSRAMPELLKSWALKWFIAINRFWETWDEFIQIFQEFFLPRGFMTKLVDQADPNTTLRDVTEGDVGDDKGKQRADT